MFLLVFVLNILNLSDGEYTLALIELIVAVFITNIVFIKFTLAKQNTAKIHAELLHSGQEASATIIDITDHSNGDINFWVTLTVEVAPKTQEKFQAQVSTQVSRVKMPRIGDKVMVLFDPKDQTKIMIKN